MIPSKPVDPAHRAETRRSLHGVAELVLAGPQFRISGSIELRASPGGFGTVRPPEVRVEGLQVVSGDVRASMQGRSFADLGQALGLTPSTLDDVYGEGSDLTPTDLITLDEAATAEIALGFADGETALLGLAPDERPILWPEHFDIGITVDEVNYGVSPGDAGIDQPYAYVGPWDRTGFPGGFWNQPFGAARTLAELGGAERILAFFREGQAQST